MKTRFPTILLVVLATVWSPWATAQPTDRPAIYVMNEPACLPSSAHPVEVQFGTDMVLGVTDWAWNFGNGQQSFVLNPVTEYDHTGNFTVSLTVMTRYWGEQTTVEENFVQINQLEFEDDFEDPDYTDAHWDYFDLDLLPNSTLEFEVQYNTIYPPLEGQQNGRIICVSGDGGGVMLPYPPEFPPEPNGRFLFDLQLVAEDPRDVSYTAFRLFAAGGTSSEAAALRVQRENGQFQVRVQGGGAAASWHTLVNPDRPVLTVDLDWHEDYSGNGRSVLRARIQEDGQPVVTQYLEGELTGTGGFTTIELGVLHLVWPYAGSAGKLRVDNFNQCDFSNRPSL